MRFPLSQMECHASNSQIESNPYYTYTLRIIGQLKHFVADDKIEIYFVHN